MGSTEGIQPCEKYRTLTLPEVQQDIVLGTSRQSSISSPASFSRMLGEISLAGELKPWHSPWGLALGPWGLGALEPSASTAHCKDYTKSQDSGSTPGGI